MSNPPDSPGFGLIEQIEDALLCRSRTGQVQNVLVGKIDNLGNALPHLLGGLRLPMPQRIIQSFNQRFHLLILETDGSRAEDSSFRKQALEQVTHF
jgi:hypothetical protein